MQSIKNNSWYIVSAILYILLAIIIATAFLVWSSPAQSKAAARSPVIPSSLKEKFMSTSFKDTSYIRITSTYIQLAITKCMNMRNEVFVLYSSKICRVYNSGNKEKVNIRRHN